LPGGFTVHCRKDKPKGLFVSVPYEGAWFWIDRRDVASKTTLSARRSCSTSWKWTARPLPC
jgi:hypothetical protein